MAVGGVEKEPQKVADDVVKHLGFLHTQNLCIVRKRYALFLLHLYPHTTILFHLKA